MCDERAVASLPPADRPDIERPRYDQNEYWGRAKHFCITTNPMNLFCTGAQLEAARKVVIDYRADKVDPKLSVDELWRAKSVYDSAYHPETGEKMFIVGRMSAQVPMNMAITGSMLTFYKSTPAVVFWQWFNQTFNASVNYTNRSGDSPIPARDLGISYVSATGGALVTALGLNALVKSMPPLVGRFVPLCAVCAANSINIPLMRRLEWQQNGVALLDSPTGAKVGTSMYAAKWAVTQVVVSRNLMAMPGMIIPPIIMNALMRKPWFARRAGMLSAPLQISMVGLFLVFMTPLCCALFPQMSSINVSSLEPEVQAEINARPNAPKVVYYNKGL